jgi:hypothetical protein
VLEVLRNLNKGWLKSHATSINLYISVTAQANGTIFWPIIKVRSHFLSIRTTLERTSVKYYYQTREKKFTFSPIGKNNARWKQGNLSRWYLNVLSCLFFLIKYKLLNFIAVKERALDAIMNISAVLFDNEWIISQTLICYRTTDCLV